jgi:hypothetical protein
MHPMSTRRFRRFNFVLATAALMLSGGAARADDAPKVEAPKPEAAKAEAAPKEQASSQGQDMLFETPYMSSVQAPSKMIYTFKSATADDTQYGRSFDDQASMKVEANKNNASSRDVFVTMFSGDREREIGLVSAVTGNPILMVFLERDMSRMKMHVGGQPVYYRNRIRAALREHAKVEPVTFSFADKVVNGNRISIQPFTNDPLGEQLRLFRSKIYEFTISDAIPGGIYEIRSVIPAPVAEGPGAAAAKPLIDERLTFARIEAGVESPKAQ